MPLPSRAPVLLLLLLAASAPARSAEVLIHRCVGADGVASLQSAPCAEGEQATVRRFARPQDPPPPPRDDEAEASAPAPPPEPAAPPLPVPDPAPDPPLFECIRHDGERYLQHSGQGQRRWVPLWALGIVPRRPDAPPRAGETLRATGSEFAPGTWVQDRCRTLTPQELCDVLREEQRALGTRFFNAQPSERVELRARQAELRPRLERACSDAAGRP